MTGWAGAAADAASAIHATFVDATIDIIPASGAPIEGITAIEINNPGDDPFGEGRSVRQRGFEVQKADLPAKPANGTIIVHGAARWRVIEVTDVADAAAWVMMVESE